MSYFRTVLSWLLPKFGILGRALLALFEEVINKELNLILPIAMEEIKKLMDNKDLKGKEKFSIVVDRVKNRIIEGQIPLLEDTMNANINRATEIGYAYLKSIETKNLK